MTMVSKEAPFDLLYERPEQLKSSRRGLLPEVREIYRGDWLLPNIDRKPYCFSNFVMSHDGRVSFAVPGHEGGGDVSGFNTHDQWLMGLLRSRSDAVMVGANTLRTESEHLWTADFIAPSHAELFSRQRDAENRARYPIQVFVTRTGNIHKQAAVFHNSELNCVVITTKEGKDETDSLNLPRTEVVTAGESNVDFREALVLLSRQFGVTSLLCEGGPRIYGSLVASGALDDEFLTISPLVIGSTTESPRPGLIEGHAYPPESSARANLVSVRRADDHLFLRTAWSVP